MEEKKNLLTYAGLKKLEDELHDLKVVKRKEVAGKIKEAREQGCLLYTSRLQRSLRIPVQLQLRSTEEQDSSIMQAKRTGIRSAGSKKRYLFQSLETGMWILQRKQKHWCVRQAVMGS